MRTLTITQLGSIQVPTFRDTPTKDWDCAQWMIWHKDLVKAFMAGAFASNIKYTQDKAIENANNVFIVHWNKSASFMNSNFCGYKSDFFNYFKSVGLGDILSYFQAVFTPTATATTEVVSSGAKAATNVAQSAGQAVENVAKGIENTSSVTKWLLPAVAVTLVAGIGYLFFTNAQNVVPKAANKKALFRFGRKSKQIQK
ncbi:MAG: hypothetical protein KIT62_07715 [Cyclobacteriaceae bacterium]|nr:hypothetical protein [Cyclobacteriaceae bacterium]